MSTEDYKSHYSVLKGECIDFMLERSEAGKKSYLADLTFGAGGHTFELFNRSEDNYIISTDQDPDALKNGRERIIKENAGERVQLEATNFEHFSDIVHDKYSHILEAGGFQAILMDLGVSSHHFDKGDRGFSFRMDAPLDMRMNYEDDSIKTAADLINELSRDELVEILTTYGEEKLAYSIVDNILQKRAENPIKTTKELEDIVFHSYPKKMRFGKTNPATKTFQALRIAVNQELRVVEQTITKLYDLLNDGGRIVIISFHSLEDRIVKNEFKKISEKNGILCRILTKKPIIPGSSELSENNRSRSAKLRVIEKISKDMLGPKELKKLKYQGLKNE